MATAHIKKVIKIGGSLAIILPREWAKSNVTAGDEMVLVGNGELRMFPVHSKVSCQDNKDDVEDGEGKEQPQAA